MKMITLRLADLYWIPIEEWDDEEVINRMIHIKTQINIENQILKSKKIINDVSNRYSEQIQKRYMS